jgi:hypothetical protein
MNPQGSSLSSTAAENRDAWLERLNSLLSTLDEYARALDWSTRKIQKSMEDSELGAYQAPALLLQQETVRVLIDPIARQAPGVEGIVDMYLLPAYDDVASLYLMNDGWRLHYAFPNSKAVATIRGAASIPLSREAFAETLASLKANGV